MEVRLKTEKEKGILGKRVVQLHSDGNAVNTISITLVLMKHKRKMKS